MNLLPFKRLVLKLLARKKLASSYIQPGVYLTQSIQPKRVLFYFNDPKRFHLGDHLFFASLVQLFINNNIGVDICPQKSMAFYFSAMGANIEENPSLDSYDLVITWIGFYDLFKHLAIAMLIIDTTDHRINLPLSNYLLSHVGRLFNFNLEGTLTKPFMPTISYPSHLINSDSRYLIYNPYLDSSPFHMRARHYKKLEDTAKEIASKYQLKIILAGTEKEKKVDHRSYDFVALDLRGKTSVQELFALASANNVLYNVSFDALIMHLFFILQKPSYILFRGRFLKKNANFILNIINPIFSISDNEKNQLITYIEA